MKKFFLLIVLPILIFGGGLLLLNLKKEKLLPSLPLPGSQQQVSNSENLPPEPYSTDKPVTWKFTGDEWRPSSTPPACPNPFVLSSPVDPDMVTAIMYPGQIRNNVYKSEGGFAFTSSSKNVSVRAPLGGYLVKARRYVAQGETQYLLVFINSCGIMYRFDHLRELDEKYKAVVDKVPETKTNETQLTTITAPFYTRAGELIGRKVGSTSTRNIFVEFGVYDLRKKTSVSKTNDKEYAPYGICWFNYFDKEISSLLKGLPLRDQASGRTSDYCK